MRQLPTTKAVEYVVALRQMKTRFPLTVDQDLWRQNVTLARIGDNVAHLAKDRRAVMAVCFGRRTARLLLAYRYADQSSYVLPE
jgi:hypothetical protein